MTEQNANQQMPQEEDRKGSRGTAKQDMGDYHSDAENVAEKHCGYKRTVNDPLQSIEPDQHVCSGRRKPGLVRSKTFDHSLLTQIQTDFDSKIERKKPQYSQLSKSNCQYHKIFKEISKEEQLRQSYTCALQKDILYQGRMFVSDHWICFHSKVFGKDTKIAIPMVSITYIKKTKTAILLPNALVIATTNDRYVFVSFLSRDNTYKFLMSICLHLKKSPCSSPIVSSAESSFRGQRSPQSPHFPLSFPADFSVLDGTARHQSQEIEESSSSDSQTPDDDKIAGSHVVIKSKEAISLNTLLFVYLFLVCILLLSSCYMAFKIISLEQKLTSLGSVTESTEQEKDFLQGSTNVNTELFSELLTINLIKLEKVQKNLQRLLDQAV